MAFIAIQPATIHIFKRKDDIVYRKLCAFTDKASEVMLAVSMVGMVIAVFCQVLFRYVLELPLFWTEEAARFLMVFAVYVGCAIGIRRDAHMGFTFIVDHSPRPVQFVMKLLQNLGILALNVYIIYYGMQVVLRNTYQVSPALQIPMWIVYAILPFAGVLACLQVIEKFIDVIAEYTKGGKEA